MCLSAITSHHDPAAPRWVLGAPFFRRNYVVFDRASRRLGIAAKEPRAAGGWSNAASGSRLAGQVLADAEAEVKVYRGARSTADPET